MRGFAGEAQLGGFGKLVGVDLQRVVASVFQFGDPAGIDVKPQDRTFFPELDRQGQPHIAQTDYRKFHILNFQLILPAYARKERQLIL